MSGNYANLGKPAESTRIDLTIGEDSDRDGLPDAWERLLLSMLTGKSNLSEITPEGDDDGDGLNNLDEYIAGTYAFDAEDGFRLNLIQRTGNPPLLEFLAVAQRTYTVYFSTNLQSWSQMEFALPGNGTASSLLPYYRATDTRTLQVEPVLPLELPPSKLFFKAKVQ